MTSTLERTTSAHRKLEEEMRDSNEKKDAVAHWEAQIAEIIQWFVLLFLNHFITITVVIFKASNCIENHCLVFCVGILGI